MHSVDVKPPERLLKAGGIIYPPKKTYCKMTQPTQYGMAQCNGVYLKVTLLET